MMPRAYLPWLAQGTLPTDPVQGAGIPCGMTEPEAALLALIADHPRQARERLTCDARLVAAARARCEQMRQRNGLTHYDAHGNVRRQGYRLPDIYGDDPSRNYLESVAVGQAGRPALGITAAEQVFAAFLNSDGHRRHILGLSDWYAGQVVAGVGYSPLPSPQGWAHWWTVITAHPAKE